MSEPITIEEVKVWRRDIVRNGAKPIDLISLADLAISQAETIKAQGEEIENLRRDSERSFSMLELFGVPKTRARYISLGIEVLVSRYDKEVFFLNAEIAKLKQERDEAYERVAKITDALQTCYQDDRVISALHALSIAFRALKSEPNPTEGK